RDGADATSEQFLRPISQRVFAIIGAFTSPTAIASTGSWQDMPPSDTADVQRLEGCFCKTTKLLSPSGVKSVATFCAHPIPYAWLAETVISADRIAEFARMSRLCRVRLQRTLRNALSASANSLPSSVLGNK